MHLYTDVIAVGRYRAVVALVPLAMILAAACGFLLPKFPLLTVPIVGGVGVLVLSTLNRYVEKITLVSLGCLLLGYAFQGRGFSYIGLRPFYIGEIVLGLGIATLAFGRIRWRFSYIEMILLVFMFFGFVRTVPYIRTEGANALRDAALWYYGAFAILVSLLLTEERLKTAIRLYGRMLPVLIGWMAVMPVVFLVLPPSLPHFPGSPLPIISLMKPGDRGVILAGLSAFVISGVYARLKMPGRMPSVFFWLCWMVSAVVVSAANRGGMLALSSSLLLVGIFQPSREGIKALTIGSVAVSLLLIVNPTIDAGGYREVSVSQLTANITSIFSDDTGDEGSVQGTKEWRLLWWGDIYEDTVKGPYFLTGKGFGLNLADYYGYQTDKEHSSLRSPHNSHMTVLARMGVTGLALWIALHVAFANHMVRALRRARRREEGIWTAVYAWLLAMWLAALVNSSFDVYLEGPQGAIPFWCVFGAGIAAMRFQQASIRQTSPLALHVEGGPNAHSARP